MAKPATKRPTDARSQRETNDLGPRSRPLNPRSCSKSFFSISWRMRCSSSESGTLSPFPTSHDSQHQKGATLSAMPGRPSEHLNSPPHHRANRAVKQRHLAAIDSTVVS